MMQLRGHNWNANTPDFSSEFLVFILVSMISTSVVFTYIGTTDAFIRIGWYMYEGLMSACLNP
jgi:hypothetical protein